MNILPELVDLLEAMSEAQQRALLASLNPIAAPIGESGEVFLERTRHIHLPTEDMEEMLRAIEAGCEGIEDDDPPSFSA